MIIPLSIFLPLRFVLLLSSRSLFPFLSFAPPSFSSFFIHFNFPVSFTYSMTASAVLWYSYASLLAVLVVFIPVCTFCNESEARNSVLRIQITIVTICVQRTESNRSSRCYHRCDVCRSVDQPRLFCWQTSPLRCFGPTPFQVHVGRPMTAFSARFFWYLCSNMDVVDAGGASACARTRQRSLNSCFPSATIASHL